MTPEQIAELERSSTLFHIALVQLGAQSVQDTLSLWDDVPPIPSAGGTSRATEAWLSTAVAYVMTRRLRARDLALAYYRYQRAVATGTTIAVPGQEDPPHLTLFELKRAFENLLSQTSGTSQTTSETQAVSEDAVTNPEQPGGDEITVEEIDGLEADLTEAEKVAEEQVRAVLSVLGPQTMNYKMGAIKPESADQVDAERQDAHAQAGRRQAAAAARESMNGARGTLFGVGSKDKRVLGFVRASRTGTPCGWCAMLISRGFVPKTGEAMYKSNEGTGIQEDGSIVTYGDLDLYHDNCQCYAVPVYSKDQMSGDQFALNRKYADLWPTVTHGLGGDAALSAWRRFIRLEAESQKPQVAAA